MYVGLAGTIKTFLLMPTNWSVGAGRKDSDNTFHMSIGVHLPILLLPPIICPRRVNPTGQPAVETNWRLNRPFGLSVYLEHRLDGVRNNCWRMFPSLLERPAIGYFQCNQQWFLEKDIVDTWSRQHHICLVLNGDSFKTKTFSGSPRLPKPSLDESPSSEGFPFSTMPMVIPKETFWKNWD